MQYEFTKCRVGRRLAAESSFKEKRELNKPFNAARIPQCPKIREREDETEERRGEIDWVREARDREVEREKRKRRQTLTRRTSRKCATAPL